MESPRPGSADAPASPPVDRGTKKEKRENVRREKLTQDQQEEKSNRALRSAFQVLRDQTDRDGQDLTNLNTSTLSDRLQEANTLSQRVKRPREQAVDSEIFTRLADAGKSMAKKLAHGGQGQTAKDFLRKLKELHVPGEEPQEAGRESPEAMDWMAIGRNVAHMWQPAVGVCCMVGTLSAQAKYRKQGIRYKKAPLAAVTRPDEIKEVEEADKQETDRNMEEIWRLLKADGGAAIPLLELVMNPHPDVSIGFGQTVENLFGLSFLVRDSKACLFKGTDGRIMVKMVPPGKGTLQGDRQQFMLAQDFATWQEWRSCVNPSDCRMRHRIPVPGRNGDTQAEGTQTSGVALTDGAGSSAPRDELTTPPCTQGTQGGSASQRLNSQHGNSRKGPKVKITRPKHIIILSDSDD